MVELTGGGGEAELGAPKKFLSYVKDYDFESSKEVRLVHSLQGELNLSLMHCFWDERKPDSVKERFR